MRRPAMTLARRSRISTGCTGCAPSTWSEARMYKALADAIRDAEASGRTLAQTALARESKDQGRTVEDIRAALKRALDVMRNAVERGLEGDLRSASGLVGGDALLVAKSHAGPMAGTLFSDVNARAHDEKEEKAAKGEIVGTQTVR